MLFCPYCKVKLHNYKINGINLDKHTCGERFCKNCQVMYHNDEEEDFHKCFRGLYQLQKVLHEIADSFFMILKVW